MSPRPVLQSIREVSHTALAHNLTLVSRDNHFARIPDLKLYHET